MVLTQPFITRFLRGRSSICSSFLGMQRSHGDRHYLDLCPEPSCIARPVTFDWSRPFWDTPHRRLRNSTRLWAVQMYKRHYCDFNRNGAEF